jgi:serine/threonine protein kinase
VLSGKFNFPYPEWSLVSSEAKTFISKLLVVDPSLRMTASQALKDPWIVNYSQEDAKKIFRKQSSMNANKFKEYVASRKK